MTGISKFEKVILLITALFFLLSAGWFVSQSNSAEEYRITTLLSGEETADSKTPEADGWPESLLEGERIDLNRAPAKDLARLPGVGEKLAGEIVAWREKFGGFQCVDELRYVSGIGEQGIQRLKPYVSVGP